LPTSRAQHHTTVLPVEYDGRNNCSGTTFDGCRPNWLRVLCIRYILDADNKIVYNILNDLQRLLKVIMAWP